jgi:hypothetical protein
MEINPKTNQTRGLHRNLQTTLILKQITDLEIDNILIEMIIKTTKEDLEELVLEVKRNLDNVKLNKIVERMKVIAKQNKETKEDFKLNLEKIKSLEIELEITKGD